MLGTGVGAGDREVMESLSSEDSVDTHTHTDKPDQGQWRSRDLPG